MRASPAVISLFLAVVNASASPSPTPTVLTPNGLGRVHVGMHLNAIASAMGNFDLYEVSGRMGAKHCYAIRSKVVDATRGITFVGVNSPALQRIDVHQPDDSETGHDKSLATQVRTREGIKLGDAESRISAVYSRNAAFLQPEKLSPSYYVVQLRQEPYGYAFVVVDGVIVESRSGHVAALKHRESCE